MSAPQQASAFNYQIPPRYTIKNITAAYTVTGADYGAILNCTGTTSYALNLAPAASIGAGFNVWIWNQTSTTAMQVTITPNGSETIDGNTLLVLNRGEGTQIVCDGTNWQTGAKKTMRSYSDNYGPGVIRPNATGNQSIAMGSGASSSNTNSISIGGSTTASGQGSIAIGVSTNSNSNNSTAIGGNSSLQASYAQASGATSLGGSYASGTDSFASNGSSNSSSYGAQSTNSIAMGFNSKANGSYATAIGGYQSIASGSVSYAFGDTCTASATYSFALGKGVSSVIFGKIAFSGAGNSGATIGLFQGAFLVIQTSTTTNTPTVLTSDAGAASTTNQVILPNNSAFSFSGTIIARQQAAGGSDYAAWEVKGAIIRGANAAATTLGSYNVNVLSKTSGASAWAIALTADTTNGGLAITATGAATTNIRWVATIQTSEVTYA